MRKLTVISFLLITFISSSAQTQLDTALNFSVKDIHGNTIELFPILDGGNFVVIDFFSTSCSSCALYAPDLQASYEDFGENSGNVFFLSIAWGDDNAGVAYFDSIHGITLPSVSGSQGGGNDVHELFQVLSTPTAILIAPDREIIEKYIWEPSHENLNEAILAAGGYPVGLYEGSDMVEADGMLLFPNPSEGPVSIRFVLEHASKCHIEVINMAGERVYESTPMNYPSGTHLLASDLASLIPGTYLLKLMIDGHPLFFSRLIMAR